ncbi:MAG: hypothetical protein ACM31C_06050 [Acidobacteriota bacterium]
MSDPRPSSSSCHSFTPSNRSRTMPEWTIYDWNEKDRRGPILRKPPRLLDETLRDGLQSPTVRDPTVEQKMELIRLMSRLGIDAVDLGLPGAGDRARRDVALLLRFVVEERLPIEVNCAARTVRADLAPIIELSQRVGVTIEVTTFIGASHIRVWAEGWDLQQLVHRTREAVEMIVAAGLPASFVTEDTTRSDTVYSSVPAAVFGRSQEIEIGHYSGKSNVVHWLTAHGFDARDDVVMRLLDYAKQQDHTLTEAEVRALLGRSQP